MWVRCASSGLRGARVRSGGDRGEIGGRWRTSSMRVVLAESCSECSCSHFATADRASDSASCSADCSVMAELDSAAVWPRIASVSAISAAILRSTSPSSPSRWAYLPRGSARGGELGRADQGRHQGRWPPKASPLKDTGEMSRDQRRYEGGGSRPEEIRGGIRRDTRWEGRCAVILPGRGALGLLQLGLERGQLPSRVRRLPRERSA